MDVYLFIHSLTWKMVHYIAVEVLKWISDYIPWYMWIQSRIRVPNTEVRLLVLNTFLPFINLTVFSTLVRDPVNPASEGV